MQGLLQNGVKLNEDTFGEQSQSITLTRIRKSLKDRLKRKYPDKENLNELTRDILKVHGLDKDNFDFINVIGSLFSDRLNDVSIDDNSNKNEKTIKGTLMEGSSPLYKALGYDLLYRVIKSLYGKREAKRLTSLMYDFSLGLSDSTNILLPYCWSMDASKLVINGRDFGQLQSLPAKRVSSYISALCETIHQMSSHLAGAIAVGTFFLDICHLSLYKEKISLEELKANPDIRKYIENEYQQFVHSVNHLSRNGIESPFTNLSIFDRNKLKTLISNDNMGWYLPTSLDYDQNYIIDYIMELQDIFLKFFDQGDPSASGRPYRFPVITINVSKKDNDIVEPEFVLDKCENFDIYRYNIFTSEGTKISSCCFKGDEIIKVYDHGKKVNTTLEDFTKLFNDNDEFEHKLNKGYQIDSLNPETMSIEKTNITGILKKKNNFNKLVRIKVDNEMISVTPDHEFLAKNKKTNIIEEITAEELKSNFKMYMLPSLFNKMEFKNIDDVCEEEYTGYVYDIELKDNHYFAANNIFSHNCRLMSDTDMLEVANQSNSFGAGGSISLGSHRVVTTNFNRIALDCESVEEYYEILERRVEDSAKILKSHRTLINHLAKAGLQPFITNGWINMNRMFSTFGILGIYEADLTLKERFGGADYMKDILTFFNTKVAEYSKEQGIVSNIEQIPGESFAVRLCNVDKMLYKGSVPFELYANQFVPLWEDKTIWEKLDIDGSMNALLTGGGIVHARIGEKLTAKQSYNLIEYSIKVGCEHFALNATYSECENGHVNFGNIDTCPECSGDIVEKLERVVGYFVPISSWNRTRREWEFPKRTTVTFE